jgi:hypothetical protein
MAKFIDGVDGNGQRITNVADPTSSNDGATKAYADLKMLFRGQWTAQAYAVNDVVYQGNKLYVCTIAVSASAPSYVGATSFGPSSSTNVTVAFPAGTAVNDTVVFSFIGDASGVNAISTSMLPAGWIVQLAPPNANGTFSSLIVATKTLVSSDITAGGVLITGSPGSQRGWSAEMHVFRNVSSVGTPASTSTTVTTTPVVTPSSSGFIVEGGANSCGNTAGAAVNNATLTAFNGTVPSTANGAEIGQGYDIAVSGTPSTARTISFPSGVTNGNYYLYSVPLYGNTFPVASFIEIGAIHDSSGRLQSTDPSTATDVATKGYADALTSYVSLAKWGTD